MSAGAHLLHASELAASAGGILYTTTITVVALTAALARDPLRRSDARHTLAILLRRHSRPK